MEKQIRCALNGVQIQTSDIDTLGETAGLADDRVLAELYRLAPTTGTAAKGIVPFGHQTSGRNQTVEISGTTNLSVVVRPFRAIVGSRTAAGTDGLLNWRDIRSGLSIQSGSTSLTTSFQFTANASGNPRWDLLYARIEVDASAATVSRKVKDPTSLVVSTQSVSVYKTSPITLGAVAGTAAASPTFPAAPADTSQYWYIPLAYVRVPAGATLSTQFSPQDLCPAENVLTPFLARSSVCTSCSTELPAARQQTYGSSGTRPVQYLSPEVAGNHDVWVVLDLRSGTAGNHSHANADVIDSRDWRDRFCTSIISLGDLNSTEEWLSGFGSTSSSNMVPSGNCMQPTDTNQNVLMAVGQSMGMNFNGTVANTSRVLFVDTTVTNLLAAATSFGIYCDHSDSGKLKLYKPGNPRCLALIKMSWSGPQVKVQ